MKIKEKIDREWSIKNFGSWNYTQIEREKDCRETTFGEKCFFGFCIFTVDMSGPEKIVTPYQCDQIGRFFGLWATFLSVWQKLICPNLPHS